VVRRLERAEEFVVADVSSTVQVLPVTLYMIVVDGWWSMPRNVV
jgi:hypothetical protein